MPAFAQARAAGPRRLRPTMGKRKDEAEAEAPAKKRRDDGAEATITKLLSIFEAGSEDAVTAARTVLVAHAKSRGLCVAALRTLGDELPEDAGSLLPSVLSALRSFGDEDPVVLQRCAALVCSAKKEQLRETGAADATTALAFIDGALAHDDHSADAIRAAAEYVAACGFGTEDEPAAMPSEEESELMATAVSSMQELAALPDVLPSSLRLVSALHHHRGVKPLLAAGALTGLANVMRTHCVCGCANRAESGNCALFEKAVGMVGVLLEEKTGEAVAASAASGLKLVVARRKDEPSKALAEALEELASS